MSYARKEQNERALVPVRSPVVEGVAELKVPAVVSILIDGGTLSNVSIYLSRAAALAEEAKRIPEAKALQAYTAETLATLRGACAAFNASVPDLEAAFEANQKAFGTLHAAEAQLDCGSLDPVEALEFANAVPVAAQAARIRERALDTALATSRSWLLRVQPPTRDKADLERAENIANTLVIRSQGWGGDPNVLPYEQSSITDAPPEVTRWEPLCIVRSIAAAKDSVKEQHERGSNFFDHRRESKTFDLAKVKSAIESLRATRENHRRNLQAELARLTAAAGGAA